MNDEIDQNTKFCQVQNGFFCTIYLEMAQVLAKADSLVIIVSVWHKTHNLSTWVLKTPYKTLELMRDLHF